MNNETGKGSMNLQGSGEGHIKCRFCGAEVTHTFADLGMSPLCERFITKEQLNSVEKFYPLKAFFCDKCFLVQLDEYVAPDEIFNDYAYFSSFSDSWVKHAKDYVDKVVTRFNLNDNHMIMELASNDGYLLQHFKALGIPVLGIEPAANVAEVAIKKGIPTEIKFFGEKTALELMSKHGQADLLIGNNVLAHVPNLNDFVAGIKKILKPSGVITMEFPHLLELMENNQFDTIYHEHFSYFSFLTVEKVFKHHNLRIFDVERLPSHGGSMRIYATHEDNLSLVNTEQVDQLRLLEIQNHFTETSHYLNFQSKVDHIKHNALEVLIGLKRQGKKVVAYGAPGKGNTFLNYCGIRQDFLDYAVDRTEYKHGRYTPGTHIPIYPPEKIKETKPDYLVILPWNLKKEITSSMSFVRDWGGQFIVFIPEVAFI